MNKHNRRYLAGALLGLALLLLLSAAPAVRAELNVIGLDWWAVAGGGVTTSSGGNYALSGTTGQPAVERLKGGNYFVQGGFWPGGAQQVKIFLARVTR